MSRVSTEVYTENFSTFIKNYADQAIQCCIDSWNHFCSEYPIGDGCKIIKEKKSLSMGNDVTIIDVSDISKNITKIAFAVDNRLTAKSLRKNSDSPRIFISFRIWWNYDGYQVRGWLNHIEFDANKGCIAYFPQIIPALPYWENQI